MDLGRELLAHGRGVIVRLRGDRVAEDLREQRLRRGRGSILILERDLEPAPADLGGRMVDPSFWRYSEVEGEPIVGILRSAVEPPPPGPKRLGGDRSLDDRLRDLRDGRSLGVPPEDAR